MAELARQPWLRGVGVRGRGRRRAAPGLGGARACVPPTRRSCSSTTRARPLVSPALVGRGRAAAAASTAPPSRCCPSPTRSSGRRTAGSTGVATRDGLGPRADAPGRAARAAAGAPSTPARTGRDLRRRGRAAGARRGRRSSTVPGEAGQHQGDRRRRTSTLVAARWPAARRAAPRDAAWAATAIPFGPDDGLRLGGIDIAEAPRLHGHSDGDVGAPRGLRRAARRGRPGRPRPPLPGRRPGDPRASTAATLLRAGRGRGWRAAGSRPASRGPDHRWAPGRASAARGWTRCATAIAELLGLDPRRGRRSRRRPATSSGDEGAGRVISATRARGRGGRDEPALPQHARRRARAVRAARARPTSACTPAGRRSTRRPTSATSAASCSPTCCAATWPGRAIAVTWVMNITDVDDKIIRDAAAAGRHHRRADRAPHRRRSWTTWRGCASTTPDVLPRATEHIPDMAALIEHAARAGPRLPHRRRLDLLPHRVAGPRTARWRALDPIAAAGRRARRGRRVQQGRRARLRALEGRQARASPAGRPRSATGGPAGTSSARP